MTEPHILEEIIDIQPEIYQDHGITIRTRKINEYAALITLHGPHVIRYIVESTRIRASDQYTFSNRVNKLLFKKIFRKFANFDFNQTITLEKSIVLDYIEKLMAQGVPFAEIKRKIQTEKKDLYTYEMDARIEISDLGSEKLSFETKIYTCPNQGPEILAGHLTKKNTEKYLSTRNFMGLITFSNMVDSNAPEKPFKFPEIYPKDQHHDWFLHFLIIDYRISKEHKPSVEIATDLLGAIKQDHQFFLERLGLNSYPCSIRLIENYVKVVHMSYLIEELEEKLESEKEMRRVFEQKTTALEQKTTALEQKTTALEQKTTALEQKTTALEQKTTALIKLLKSKGMSESEIEEYLKKANHP